MNRELKRGLCASTYGFVIEPLTRFSEESGKIHDMVYMLFIRVDSLFIRAIRD